MIRPQLYFLALLIGLYLLVMPAFVRYLAERPLEEKLGYFPAKEVVKASVAEHKQSVAALIMLQVMYYFGGSIDRYDAERKFQTDYTNMARLIKASNYLDPYNFDIYYLSQAAFPLGPNGARFVNGLIENGMKYRTWDADMPFYAGFNAAFILKDYAEAARLLQRASEISGNSLYASLAMKFFNKAGEADFGIRFMDSMAKNAPDDTMRRLYQNKKRLLEGVKVISIALQRYNEKYGHNPTTITELVTEGLLLRLPKDPFGGNFYLTDEGVVETTSGGLSVKGI